MSDKINIYTQALGDTAYLARLGEFVKQHRLDQNKTQSQLALESGINRSTLIEFEKGKRINLITFIQLLRSLNLLYMLDPFIVQQELSPLQLAELEMAKRKRASKLRSPASKPKPKSDW
ncbi:transcriptional regulator [Sphingobacteriaceae bacterium]|nr:transcriptional regulator [Sphingobacteriaceae bacterium]